MYFYISNIVHDATVIADREAQFSGAGCLRTLFIARSVEEPVTIVSIGAGSKRGYHRKREEKVDGHINITYLPELHITLFGKKLRHIFYAAFLLCFLIRYVRRQDTLIVYNTEKALFMMLPLLIAQRLVKFRYILETEELYTYARGKLRLGFWESASIRNAEGYIVVSEPQTRFLPSSKPHILCGGYGMEDVEQDNRSYDKTDPPIVIYSGRLDYAGGVELFLEATRSLTTRCRVVITGSGPAEHIVSSFINQNEKVEFSYLGHLERDEYYGLLASSTIGLNPIRCSEDFSDVSFPSKVLQYLEYGIVVITSAIPAIEQLAPLKTYIRTYEKDDPRSMAGAIDEILRQKIAVERMLGDTAKFMIGQKMKLHNFITMVHA